MLRNAQMPYNQVEVKAENIIGLRLRADGSTVVLQNVEPTHLHVRDPFYLVCKFTYESLKKEG